MDNRTIYITQYDAERLKKLIVEARRLTPRANEALESLERELGRALTVEPAQVPPDTITMNSQVRLVDLDNGEEMIATLVFPQDANMDENKISILAPVGTGMLGYRVDDVFMWSVPDGVRRLKVAEILYQPEAAGDYQL